jgi:AraC-like DNA-binding protein
VATGTEQAKRRAPEAIDFRASELVPARNAALFAAAIDAVGLDAGAALQRIGLSRAQLRDPNALVSAATTYRLLAIASEHDPTFPVRAGAALPWGGAGLADYVNGTRATLGAAIDSLIRFVRVVGTNSRYALDDEPRGAFLRAIYSPAPPPELQRMLSEFTLSLLFGRLRDIAGRDVAIEVRFLHAAPAWEAALRARFGCKLVFAAPAAGILFPRASLATPSQRADPRLEEIVERHALDVLRTDPRAETLADHVAAAVRAALPDGLPSMRRIAKALALSERTLRRRLADQRLTFARVRDAELERLARELLRTRASTIEEVAYLLGFSEARAFQRAFKRWTGRTPGAFRAEAARADESRPR